LLAEWFAGFFYATSEPFIMFLYFNLESWSNNKEHVTEVATLVSGLFGWWPWCNNTNGRIFSLEQQRLSKRLIHTLSLSLSLSLSQQYSLSVFFFFFFFFSFWVGWLTEEKRAMASFLATNFLLGGNIV